MVEHGRSADLLSGHCTESTRVSENKNTGHHASRPVPVTVDFGREICCSLEAAAEREWRVTNGIGGFASGTVAGPATRRYHGLLVGALAPPLGRTLLVAGLEETANYDESEYALSTCRWVDGTVNPRGYINLERFRLEGSCPVWTFACADARPRRQKQEGMARDRPRTRRTRVRDCGPEIRG